MSNYIPNLFITQPIYDPTRPFATPSTDEATTCVCLVIHNKQNGM